MFASSTNCEVEFSETTGTVEVALAFSAVETARIVRTTLRQSESETFVTILVSALKTKGTGDSDAVVSAFDRIDIRNVDTYYAQMTSEEGNKMAGAGGDTANEFPIGVVIVVAVSVSLVVVIAVPVVIFIVLRRNASRNKLAMTWAVNSPRSASSPVADNLPDGAYGIAPRSIADVNEYAPNDSIMLDASAN